MPKVTLQQLLMSGAHFGHMTRRWNPKMKPYIFMERNGIYIIDLNKTVTCLERAVDVVKKTVASGEKVLFLGTKKQAKDIIKIEADRCEMPYVAERWLGGMLTNFVTIRKSIKFLKNLEKKATDGTYDQISKKEILQIERQKEKLEKNLGGIRDMNRVPGALFVVDTKKEAIAIAEAKKLNIPIIGMIDTNSDPDNIDYPIPANDDAFKSISLIVHTIADTILESQMKTENSIENKTDDAVKEETDNKPEKETKEEVK